MKEDTEEEVTLTEDRRVTQRDISSMSETINMHLTRKRSLQGLLAEEETMEIYIDKNECRILVL